MQRAAPKTMAESVLDPAPTKENQHPKADVQDRSKVSAASAAPLKDRPADLGLARSLSKSDSDLLASPSGEEDRGLANRSGSVSNCRPGQPSMERMPSFASEWDEVTLLLWGWHTERSGTVEHVNVLKRKCVTECE